MYSFSFNMNGDVLLLKDGEPVCLVKDCEGYELLLKEEEYTPLEDNPTQTGAGIFWEIYKD